MGGSVRFSPLPSGAIDDELCAKNSNTLVPSASFLFLDDLCDIFIVAPNEDVRTVGLSCPANYLTSSELLLFPAFPTHADFASYTTNDGIVNMLPTDWPYRDAPALTCFDAPSEKPLCQFQRVLSSPHQLHLSIPLKYPFSDCSRASLVSTEISPCKSTNTSYNNITMSCDTTTPYSHATKPYGNTSTPCSKTQVTSSINSPFWYEPFPMLCNYSCLEHRRRVHGDSFSYSCINRRSMGRDLCTRGHQEEMQLSSHFPITAKCRNATFIEDIKNEPFVSPPKEASQEMQELLTIPEVSPPDQERRVRNEKRKRSDFDKKFVCSLCNMRTTSSGHLMRHLRTHAANRRYSCTVGSCNVSYSKRRTLERHQMNAHPEWWMKNIENMMINFENFKSRF